jgi:bifunctional non-homologous end joining protein LigD
VADPKVMLEVAGREVGVSNPGKVYFPQAGLTKMDLVQYYLAVADGALRGVGDRPMALKRFVNGAEGEPFFQKRAPDKRPDWIETAELRFPSGRTADEVVLQDAAGLAWVVNLGCIDLNPHPVRASDLDHPDELRVDLDPVPGVEWPQIRDVALVARDVLADFGLTGWPKTSGSRGIHIYARILPNWGFTDVRRAAVAVAREIERRAPEIATAKWWKEERHGVFVDYNQNAKDRTVASAYSIRPVPDARVSTPLTWDEVPDCDAADYTIATVPARFAAIGDPWAGIDEAAGSLDGLLELAARDEAAGVPDAPWPPHYEKQEGEAPRVQPSKRRAPAKAGSAKPGAGKAAPAEGAPAETAVAASPTGRRKSTMPLIEIARAATKAEAMEGLELWKARHAQVWPLLEPADVLVDSMRGRSYNWTRIRINLQHVPEPDRPAQEPLDVDYDPWENPRLAGVSGLSARMKVATTRFYAGGCHSHPARLRAISGKPVTTGAALVREGGEEGLEEGRGLG